MKIAVLTSGGDAPGMNACIRSVVRYALKHDIEVYGVKQGYAGLIANDIVALDRTSVSDIIQRGGTFLCTDRCPEFHKVEYQQMGADNLRALGIDNLVVIGGDGSFRGAQALSQNCGVKVIGVPGTIDNDLAYTDYTIGFDTAVNSVLNAINSLRDTMQAHNRVHFLEVMGRHCGDIALHAGIAGGAEYILIPEVPFSIEDIANSILESASMGKRSNLVLFAEGAGDIYQVCKQFNQLTGIEPRITKFGYIQRGGSPSRLDRILACRFGVEAVRQLQLGNTGLVIGRRGGKTIAVDIDEALAIPKNLDMDMYDIAMGLA